MGVFLFSFSGVWIDREMSNYTSPLPHFTVIPYIQTRPIGTNRLNIISYNHNIIHIDHLENMFSLMNAKENRVIILRTTRNKLLNDKTKSPKPRSRGLFPAIK